jgi:hypothetical protein
MLIQSRNKCLNAVQKQKQVLKIYTYSETCLNRTLSKSETSRQTLQSHLLNVYVI